ncbi:5-formyltetrahydrofolate cyclo-ligase, mitochondrial isoform X1 [Arachis stenosperma]|uniref:5-formyltetrahydrofolate cyclo-ligase, mitochondrial isoform X1 n=1 Tax=Arachis stenosperma TaxID=217475 RepID=UPI0025ABC24A|nr:5-formyltetrahydrofolate cyclo-ligase, mitochondrial isoform X1 [Arachis stenosperma]
MATKVWMPLLCKQHPHNPPLSLSFILSPFQHMTMASSNTQDGHLDAIFNQKRALRTQVRKTLKAIHPSHRSQQDDAIQNIISEAPWFKSSLRLCAYISCSALREVDTSKLLSQILQDPVSDGKKLYVPRVEDKNSHMRMLRISRIDDLIANSMDILEPAPIDAYGNAREDVMQANEPVDLFLLPGLAFDKSGRRLGRGGGYYDTFLKNYKDLANTRNWIQPLLVALSYSEQILDEGVIPMTSSDVPIDALVSPAGVIPITTAAINRSMVPLESGAKGDLDSGFFCNNG